MRCRRIAAGLLAGVIAPVAGACNDALCTRTSECDDGFVCTREARCEPAPDASPNDDDGGGGGDGGVDAGTPAGTPDASSLDAGPPDAGLPDAGIDFDAEF